MLFDGYKRRIGGRLVPDVFAWLFVNITFESVAAAVTFAISERPPPGPFEAKLPSKTLLKEKTLGKQCKEITSNFER